MNYLVTVILCSLFIIYRIVNNSKSFLRYITTVTGVQLVDVFSKEDKSKQPATAIVNLQLRNSMALLRRCCNHPYLIEHPVEDNGQLRIDESLITAGGKLMLLDRMLTDLKKNGHKVLSVVLFL